MHVCICIYIYICMCIYIYRERERYEMCVYVCVYIYIYISQDLVVADVHGRPRGGRGEAVPEGLDYYLYHDYHHY